MKPLALFSMQKERIEEHYYASPHLSKLKKKKGRKKEIKER